LVAGEGGETPPASRIPKRKGRKREEIRQFFTGRGGRLRSAQEEGKRCKGEGKCTRKTLRRPPVRASKPRKPRRRYRQVFISGRKKQQGNRVKRPILEAEEVYLGIARKSQGGRGERRRRRVRGVETCLPPGGKKRWVEARDFKIERKKRKPSCPRLRRTTCMRKEEGPLRFLKGGV